MNRHAYLIMAHNQPQLLKMLCQLLDSPCHDIYIHIDAKSKTFPIEEIEGCTEHSQIYFTRRTKVMWGGFSQINCELLLLETAMAQHSYSYYHLLSGADLPLKTPQELYSWFENSNGSEFVEMLFDKDRVWDKKIEKRIKYYYPLRNYINVRDNYAGVLEKKFTKLQQRFGVDRTKKLGRPLASGGQWFSITHSLAKYITEHRAEIKKHFSSTGCGDEVFLQTYIRGTEFEDRLFCHHSCRANMRFIDWQRGNPYTFTEADFDQLINSEYMFARKFSIAQHPEICLKIFNYLKEKQEADNGKEKG